MTTISAAMSGGKAALELLQALAGMAVDNAARPKINEAMSEVMKVNINLIQAQQYLMELQRQNDELRQQIKTHDEFAARKAEYKLVQTTGGAQVFQSLGSDSTHFVCPTCLDAKREFHILQDTRGMSGTFECPKCKYPYLVNSRRHGTPIQTNTKGRFF